jgi:hypothetical protein
VPRALPPAGARALLLRRGTLAAMAASIRRRTLGGRRPELRQTGFRWIKAYALLEPLQQLRGHILIIRKRLLQLWVCSIDTLRRLIQAMQSLWPRRSTFHIIAWLGAHENMGALGNLSAGLLRPRGE